MAKAELDLDINLVNANSELNQLEKKANKSGKNAGKAFGSSFSLGAKLAIGAAVGFVAFRKLKGVLDETIKASSIQQNAVNSLNSAMKINGDYTNKASQDMQNFASKLQSVSTIGDEVTIEMLAFTKSLGISNEMSKKVVEASANMASALGIDYKTAVQETAKSLTGMRGRVASMIPALKDLTTEQLKAGMGVEVMLKQFGGSASSKLLTFDGITTALSNTWGDFYEVVGNIITRSPAIIKVITLIKDEIEKMTKSLADASSGDIIGNLIQNLAIAGQAINSYMIVPFVAVRDSVSLAFDGINVFLTGIVAGFMQMAEKVVEILEFAGIENSFTQGIKDLAETTTAVANESFAGFKESFASSFDFSSSDSINNFLEKLRQIGSESKNMKETVSESFSSMNKKVSTSTAKVTIDMKKLAVDGIANSVQAIGSAVAKGENLLSAFSASILNILGDVAIATGKQLIAIGLGLEALQKSFATLSGGLAIAAGVALVALGGFMKSAGSSLSSAATSAASGATSGSTGGTEAVSIEPAQREDLVSREEQKPSITLNVQGDILDSDQTGSRIVTLLNDAFNKEGVVLDQGFA